MSFLDFLGILITGAIGFIFAGGVSFIAIFFLEEMYEKITNTYSPEGQGGAIVWLIALVPTLIGTLYGMVAGYSSWELFFHPLYVNVVTIAIFVLLGLLGDVGHRYFERK